MFQYASRVRGQSGRRSLLASLLIAGLLLLCFSPDVHAQRVQAFVSKDTVSIGERFELILVAERNFMLDALLPTFDAEDSSNNNDVLARLGDIELLGLRYRGGGYFGTQRPGVRADTVVFEATTFALDRAYVPSIVVPFAAGRDTTRVASASFTVPVASHLPPDASDVRDLAPLATFPRAWWPWIVAALFGLLLAGGLLWLYTRREEEPPPTPAPAPAPEVSPHEIASRRLCKLLQTTPLDDTTQMKPFFVELVDILRTYLTKRAGIAAHECTTRELVYLMKRQARRQVVDRDIPERLETILSQADSVKFARATPDAEDARRAAHDTQALLDRLEEHLRPPAQEINGEGSESTGNTGRVGGMHV